MKKLMIAMMLGLLVTGCGLMNSKFVHFSPEPQVITSTRVGEPIFRIYQECKNDVYGTVQSTFTEELTYLGKTGSTIRIGFREFSNNLARPAFSQELTYDLSESKTIVYKSLTIEVIEATNSSITFEVLGYTNYQNHSKIGGC